ncbi:uncharacterized protein LOC142328959 isoform X3 [Lycorma delicatula]|uniref:uncharacterized protein LOC142328959 isoform X3 n=1 Tax=Lycorma delicatula TaxID=130591 RepID=UPI003F5135A7
MMDSDDNYKLFDGLDPLEALINNDINLNDDYQIIHSDDNEDNSANNSVINVNKSIDNEHVLIIDDDDGKKSKKSNINSDVETINIELDFNQTALENNVSVDYSSFESKRKIGCSKGSFTKKERLRKPQKGRTYKCLIDGCNRTFFHICNYKVHQKLHEKSELKCKYCFKVFSDTNRLKLHENKHRTEGGDVRLFHCLVTGCCKTFLNCELLHEHELKHDLKSRPYHCKQCPKTFSSRYSFTKHLHIHRNIRPHSCLECVTKVG